MLCLSWLIQAAGISRNGYYTWLRKSSEREKRELRDRADFELIIAAYNYRGYKKGARSIYMYLLRQGVRMNIKKIRRLMKKYGLVCPIRKPNPYRSMLKTDYENKVAPNLLNRQFRAFGARKALLTDITYLYYGRGQKCYLSVIKDAYTKEILAHVTSATLKLDFVLETFRMAVRLHGNTFTSQTMIHSDQGAHYTATKFSELINDAELLQSMSRKANCWDNAPQESFFGHMKDEIDISGCDTINQVSRIIDDWIDYYNNERYQWGLAKLAPTEYYKYISTGEYPPSRKED